MARGTALSALVTMLRRELGHTSDSGVTGISKDDQFKQVLRRWQEMLYDENDWPFMFRRQDKPIVAGSRFYDLPSDINFDGVVRCWHKWSSNWIPLEYGISVADYNADDPDDNERNDPVEKWQIVETGSGPQVEIWPLPASAGTLRFEGKASLGSLVADTDTADLDDILIVLHAAAELRAGNEDAKIKGAAAERRLAMLKARQSKSGPVVIGGAHRDRFKPKGTIIRIAGA